MFPHEANAASLPGPTRRRNRVSVLLDFLARVGSASMDLLLPRRCPGCGERVRGGSSTSWCGACLAALPLIASPICPVCGRPYPKSPDSGDHLCGECAESAFAFHSARSAVVHTGLVRDLIHRFKFSGRLEYAAPLASLLSDVVRNHTGATTAELILPVPLHLKRLRDRGFNQSGILAGFLGKRLELPVGTDVLLRTDWKRPQTRLTRAERLDNVRHAFSVAMPWAVKTLRVLIVDDVFTTGTTLSECARVLLRAGAAEVHAVTVSRSVPELKPPA